MFSKLAIIFISAATLVAALPGGEPATGTTTVNKCNVGKLECCQSVQDASSKAAEQVMGILGLAIGSITGQVGLTCNPITVLGVGAASNCNAQPVCCKGNNFNGLLVAGCDPVNLSV